MMMIKYSTGPINSKKLKSFLIIDQIVSDFQMNKSMITITENRIPVMRDMTKTTFNRFTFNLRDLTYCPNVSFESSITKILF